MKNKTNDSDISLSQNRKRAYNQGLPKRQVGMSDVPKDTMTRLDMKVMKQRRGLGYEQLQKQMVGKLEKDLKGAMKAQNQKFSDVPRHLGKDHMY